MSHPEQILLDFSYIQPRPMLVTKTHKQVGNKATSRFCSSETKSCGLQGTLLSASFEPSCFDGTVVCEREAQMSFNSISNREHWVTRYLTLNPSCQSSKQSSAWKGRTPHKTAKTNKTPSKGEHEEPVSPTAADPICRKAVRTRK